MTGWHRPLCLSGADGHGDPLAGQAHVRFEQVVDGQGQTNTPTPDQHAALTAERPNLCGLTLTRPRIMGILNVTPDSFSDGGSFTNVSAALAHAQAMQGDVDIIDIGGESTRPGADHVTEDEEIRRTAPVIQALRDAGLTTPISIDTRRAKVAEAAIKAGANIVNDVSALTHDPDLAAFCAENDLPTCLMHMRGTPQNMQDAPHYDDVVDEVLGELTQRIDAACAAGIRRENLIVDPGIGFAKTQDHNLTMLRGLAALHGTGLPILLGVSRKRFIGSIGQATEAKDRVAGSVAVALYGVSQGAQILRVHDTKETAQALRLNMAITAPKPA